MNSRGLTDGRSAMLFIKHVIRKIFLEDWLLKLTALLITLALWYGVSVANKKGTATLEAALTIRPPEGAVLMSTSQQTVRISVSGDDRSISNLYARKDLNVTADLTQSEPGDLTVTLTPGNVSIQDLPSGIKLDDIQPNRIVVSIEPLVKSELPIEPVITGEPAAGYEVYSVTVVPPRAHITGPKSFMESLGSVPTSAVDISGAKNSVVAHQVTVKVNNPRVTIVPDSIVDVTVSIGEKRVGRTIDTTANGKRVSVALFGPKSAIAKLKPADLRVEISKGDDGSDVPQVILPESLRSSVEVRDVKVR
jgi:YbbR domain-containing protein